MGQRKFAVSTCVIECAIHTARKIEWYIFIGPAIVYTLPILILQEECMPTQIHLCKAFTCAGKTFISLTLKG